MASAAAAAVLLAGIGACTANGFVPDRVTEYRDTQENFPRGTALLQRTMVDAHRAARAAVGLPPMVWDAGLAADARDYAQTLARTGRFEHADQSAGVPHQGENLWTGTRDAYAYAEMVGHWVAEGRDFVNRPTPGFSRTAHWQDVAHYTQIVWRDTTRLGCATASNDRDDYLVCRYSPSGNVVGDMAF